ncbi:MAG: TrmH family RNA methyltransferase [Calditrichaeota bacterium]|nr:MAG: TrmH family RNA methyltransferase [Calditrichota bacterium]
MDNATKQELMTYLSQYVTQHKLHRIDAVLKNRTRHIAIVLEDLYQTHNASAVIRSCECFGIQDLYAIENKNVFRTHKAIASGSGKWVDVHRFTGSGEENSAACIATLKQKNYQIVVTTLNGEAVPPDAIDLSRPVALFFGNEELGVSPNIVEAAESFVKIPMFGFTQSFNISVSAALLLSNLITRLHQSQITWRLSEQEMFDLRLDWIQRVEGNNSKKMALLKQHFFQNRQSNSGNGQAVEP